MNVRTVVHIQEYGDEATVFSLDSPKSHKEAGKVRRLTSLPERSPFLEMQTGDGSPDHVMKAGRKLFDDLSTHPAVHFAMDQALQQGNGGCSPLYLWLHDVTTADSLPWEAICWETSEFLSLDNRWPIVRVHEAKEADPRLLYNFEPPLRITAVLSAAGKDDLTRASAIPQWRAMYQAIQKGLAGPNPIPILLTVLVGEESLRDEIRALQVPWIHCDYITDKDGLLEKIRAAQPHLLHFFSHGTSEEVPHLQIGSFTDWEAEQGGSIAITAVELRQVADPKQGIWLVTLNCCESATQARDGRALASSLVAAGFPAALGMREKIDVQLAHMVCESFYPALLELIDQAEADGPNQDIEWAQALSRVRSKLAGACKQGSTAQEAARGCKSWTVPALYARREPFLLKRIAPQVVAPPGLSDAKKRQLDYIMELQRLRTKASEDYKGAPPDVLDNVLADYDQQLAKATARLKQTN